MSGKFIVFEGSDGCGKSTMLEAVRRHLEVKGVDAVFVQDPGGTAIGKKIRKILLDPGNTKMCAMTELMLYAASRAQLVGEVIRPALEKGRTVISDRFTVSTLVYQGVAGVLPEEDLRRIVRYSSSGFEPDVIVMLDVPVEIGLARVGKEQDRMEAKGLLFYEEVRQRYLGFADGAPEGLVHIVDAANSILEVKKEILEIVDAIVS